MSRSKKCLSTGQKWDKTGQNRTKRDIFSWTFSIEVNPDSKPDGGLKQPCFSLTGLIALLMNFSNTDTYQLLIEKQENLDGETNGKEPLSE